MDEMIYCDSVSNLSCLHFFFFLKTKREGESVGVCDQYNSPKLLKQNLVHRTTLYRITIMTAKLRCGVVIILAKLDHPKPHRITLQIPLIVIE